MMASEEEPREGDYENTEEPEGIADPEEQE